jgi:dCMP deaminase
MRESWDRYFMDLAAKVASRSKDESTKVGAIAVGPDREVRTTAYNGFPRLVNDNVPERHVRPRKYLYAAHGEENIVSTAARIGVSIKGCTIYVNCIPPLPPCATCARMMIQAGIVRVVYAKAEVPERWREQYEAALEMLHEANVQVDIMEV